MTSFVVSLAGAIVSFGYQFAAGLPEAIRSPAGMAMTATIVAGVAFFWWYSRRSAARGILR